MIRRIAHAAYRCLDSQETAKFYTEVLGLRLAHTLQNDYVPSVKLDCPHCHLILELPDGSGIAFFEAPGLPPPERDPGRPQWIEHLAFEVANDDDLREGLRRLEEHGITNTGIVDHGIGHSIYFNDPSGNRIELTHWLDQSPENHARVMAEAYPKLLQWVDRKRREPQLLVRT